MRPAMDIPSIHPSTHASRGGAEGEQKAWAGEEVLVVPECKRL